MITYGIDTFKKKKKKIIFRLTSHHRDEMLAGDSKMDQSWLNEYP